MVAPISVAKGLDLAVIVATHRLTREAADIVIEACAKAGVRFVPWQPSEKVPTGNTPMLIVSGVAAGERRVPEDVLELLTETSPGLPLLLLCEEPLVRPTMFLQNGRVTLLGPKPSVAKICSRIRVYRSEKESHKDDRENPIGYGEAPVWTREHQRPLWWAAEFVCEGSRTKPLKLPLADKDLPDGFTAILPPPRGAPLAQADERRLVELLETPSADTEKALAESKLPVAGAVRLLASAESWVLYCAQPTCPIWIYSPMRLPNFFQFPPAGVAAPFVRRLRSLAGDVVVALSAPIASLATQSAEVMAAFADGGPAVLDLIETRLRDAPFAVSGIVAEVR